MEDNIEVSVSPKKRMKCIVDENHNIIIKSRLSKSSAGYYFNVSKCDLLEVGKTYKITVVSHDGKELIAFELPIIYQKGLGKITLPTREIEYFIIKGTLTPKEHYYLICKEKQQ